jgi:Raf kinase inhibitor-like YbhB/YbcL family protein
MDIGHRIAQAAGKLLSPVRAGSEKLAINKLERGRTMAVTSFDFVNGSPLPARQAGKDAAPPRLGWTDSPAETREFVILGEDPDAPLPKPFVHWLVYGIPAGATTYPLDAATGSLSTVPSKVGKNSKGKLAFAGATPPPGHGVHHYHFEVFALDTELPFSAGADRETVVAAMKGHVLASGEVIGTYEVH